MNKKIQLLILTSIAVLSGCASRNDVAINSSFDESVWVSQQAQRDALIGQSNAIAASSFECNSAMTVAECALGQVAVSISNSKEIASLEWKGFQGTRGKTGVDVQVKAVDKLSAQIPVLTLGGVMVKQGNESGDDTKINSGGGTVEIKSERNRATSMGKDNQTTTEIGNNTENIETVQTEDMQNENSK